MPSARGSKLTSRRAAGHSRFDRYRYILHAEIPAEPPHVNNLTPVSHRLGQFVGCPDPKTTGVNIQVPHTPANTTRSVSSGSNAPERRFLDTTFRAHQVPRRRLRQADCCSAVSRRETPRLHDPRSRGYTGLVTVRAARRALLLLPGLLLTAGCAGSGPQDGPSPDAQPAAGCSSMGFRSDSRAWAAHRRVARSGPGVAPPQMSTTSRSGRTAVTRWPRRWIDPLVSSAISTRLTC
jgi:hypothetical protein